LTRSIFLVFFSLALILLAIQPAYAADAVVGTGTPASCTETAFDGALDEIKAAGGGTITFNCGGATTIPFSAAKYINFDITIDGSGVITLSGGNSNRLFVVEAGINLILQNITLANGYSNLDDGGAIFNSGNLTLENTTIRDSNTGSSSSGGAIVSYGSLTIANSRFENNGGGNGGALYLRWEAGDATITGSTFYHNYTTNQDSGWGGAILLWDGADAQISASDLEGNTARYGGAIHNQFGNSTLDLLDGTELRDNQAQFQGGGIYNASGASTTLTQVTLRNNRATDLGGGIYNSGSGVTLTNSAVLGNSATAGWGGGVYNDANAVAWFTYTTLQNNSAMFGGGISNSASQIILINATVSSNYSYSGGGIYNDANGIATLIFVTLSGNVANGEGGGIYNLDEGNTYLDLKSTIVADNEGGDCFGRPAGSALFSLWSDNSCAYTSGAGNKPNTPALLSPLADNGGFTQTHMLAADSPAVDAGQCNVDILNDQRQVTRPQGLTCDIGAVERQSNDGDSLIFLPLAFK
jgi:hypothetical protein